MPRAAAVKCALPWNTVWEGWKATAALLLPWNTVLSWKAAAVLALPLVLLLSLLLGSHAAATK